MTVDSCRRTSSLRSLLMTVRMESTRHSRNVRANGNGQYRCWNFLHGLSRSSSGAQSHIAGSTLAERRESLVVWGSIDLWNTNRRINMPGAGNGHQVLFAQKLGLLMF